MPGHSPPNPELPSPSRLAAHLARLEHGLLERGAAVRLALLAALAGEHMLLIGPPGTAKSELARRLHRAFDGARYFERLLTRFSTPEELFGPLSLKALEADRYERLSDGYLPTAGIAFLDEVFKANSAILNALLTLLNEREFDNGAGRVRTPLVSVIGASNETPTDDSLQAFHDRFLLRVPVAPVGDAAFVALLELDDTAPSDDERAAPITPAERRAIGTARDTVALGDAALQALVALRAFVARHGLAVSDRRWRQMLGLMRCAALTEGRARVDALDLWLAPYVVCPDAQALARVVEWVDEEVAHAVPRSAPWLGHAVEAFERQLDIEQRLPADAGDAAADGAGKLALARTLGGDDSDGMPRIVSAALEDRLRRRFSPVHVAARLAQVDEVIARAHAARATVQAALEALTLQLAGRLWLPPELAARWCGAHRQTLALLDGYLQRLAACRAGFADLPFDTRLPVDEPAPVDLDAGVLAR